MACLAHEVSVEGGMCACEAGYVRQWASDDDIVGFCVPWTPGDPDMASSPPPEARPPYGAPYNPMTQRPDTGLPGQPQPQPPSPGSGTGSGGEETPETPMPTDTPTSQPNAPWARFCDGDDQFWSDDARACIRRRDGESETPEQVSACYAKGQVWDEITNGCIDFKEKPGLLDMGIPEPLLAHCVRKEYGGVPVFDCQGVMFATADSGEPTDIAQWNDYLAMQRGLEGSDKEKEKKPLSYGLGLAVGGLAGLLVGATAMHFSMKSGGHGG